MSALEEIAMTSPFIDTLGEANCRAALAECSKMCEDIENKHPQQQHIDLENAEKDLNRQRPYDRSRKLVLAAAYSILAEYHAEFLSRHLKFFLNPRVMGPKAETKLFDVHYFVGRNDFYIPHQKNGLEITGFHAKACEHFEAAKQIWHRIHRVHERIAYRHARIADVLHYLYRLQTPRDNTLLDQAIYHLNGAYRHITSNSSDLISVMNIAKNVVDWAEKETRPEMREYQMAFNDFLKDLQHLTIPVINGDTWAHPKSPTP